VLATSNERDQVQLYTRDHELVWSRTLPGRQVPAAEAAVVSVSNRARRIVVGSGVTGRVYFFERRG
jgi:hypothetical protein